MADYWYCPKCDYKNRGSVKTCVSCGYSNKNPITHDSDKNKLMANKIYSWYCPKCDYKNKGSVKTCVSCGYSGEKQIIYYSDKNAEYEKLKANKTYSVYSLRGVRGRHMTVYDNKVVITTSAGIGSLITGNFSDGEKTIYYVDCIGVQFKRSGFEIGYIQLETASGIMNNKSDNFFNENTFTFDTTVQSNEEMAKVVDYIKQQIDKIKNAKNDSASAVTNIVQQTSAADEIIKFKNLLDMGVITQEEFDEKKKQLLGL